VPYFAQAAARRDDDLEDMAVMGDDAAVMRALHRVIKSTLDETDTRRLHYNTVVARLDEFANLFTPAAQRFEDAAARAADPDGFRIFLHCVNTAPLILAPFAPHLADALWQQLGHTRSVHVETLPLPNEDWLREQSIVVVVQVNGKVRARFAVAPGAVEADLVERALREPTVTAQIDGKQVRKVIFVPDKLLNIVAA
jgi:leucyl-tRNA synthetase